ncbi:sugar ABC transporter permease [Nocardia sp. CA2R105]|uniref:carbohydrate ABC transporter permease n=1 Tax=Nocardia coffeae TaxID=2873381 RepID=UPI001CA5F823|nr:sugar ABC transporter permease [Nocardia coffeae]MBY8861194.1 sugar ABC transporter permease [Nocardia coffeae]
MTALLDRPAPGRFVEPVPPPPRDDPRPVARRPLLRRLASGATPYLYLIPALAGLVVWVYSPLVQTIELSFYDWNLVPTTPARPAGWSNYVEAFNLPQLGRATVNTVVYLLALLPFTIVIPVVVVLLSQRVHGRARAFYRTAIFAPYLIAPVVTAIVWRWLLDPNGGLVNQILGLFGIAPISFLRDPKWAMWSIVVIVGWQLLGFAVLVVSAGLSGISDDYAAAARTDGATERQITRRITLPLLSPTLLFMATLTVLAAAQLMFPMIQTLTQGGPGDSTTNLYYLLYDTAFGSFDVGLASAASVLFFLGFGLIAWGAVWLMDRWSFHDD